MRRLLPLVLALALVAAGCGEDEGDGGETETEVCVVEDVGLRALSCDQENAIPVAEFERFDSCVDETTGAPADCGIDGTVGKQEFEQRAYEDRQLDKIGKELTREVEPLYRDLKRWAAAYPQQAADACLAVESIESIDSPELAEIADNYLRRSLAPYTPEGTTPETVATVLSNFCNDY